MNSIEQSPVAEAQTPRGGVALLLATVAMVSGGALLSSCGRPDRANEPAVFVPLDPAVSPEASSSPAPEPEPTYDADCLGLVGKTGVRLAKDDCETLRPLAKDRSEYRKNEISFKGPTSCGGSLMGEVRVGADGVPQLTTQHMPQRFQRAVAAVMEDPVVRLFARHAEDGASYWMSNTENENGWFSQRREGVHEDRVLFCFGMENGAIYRTVADMRRIALHEYGHAAYDDWREAAKTDPETKRLIDKLDQVCLEEARLVGERVRTELHAEALEVLEGIREGHIRDGESGAAAVTQRVMESFDTRSGLDPLVGYIDGTTGCETPGVHRTLKGDIDMFELAAQQLGIDYKLQENQVSYTKELAALSRNYKKAQAVAYGYADEQQVLAALGDGGHPGDSIHESVAGLMAATEIDPQAVIQAINKLPHQHRTLVYKKLDLLWRIIQKNEPKELTSRLRLPEVVKAGRGQYSPAHYLYQDTGVTTVATYKAGEWQTASHRFAAV